MSGEQKPLKILYHHRIASKDGQYVHVEEIVNALQKLGHQIIMVAPRVAENSDFGSDGGWVSKLKAKLPHFIYELLEFGYAFYAFFKLLWVILKEKPDFIYERYNLFLPSGIWVKKLTGLKLLLEVNAPLLEERSKYDGIKLKGLARWSQHYCWRNADMCLPVTNVLADYLRAVGVPEERITVIPNGINEEEFSKPIIRPERLPDTQGKTIIGFVGFVRDWHGLDRVINLMAENRDLNAFFLIVGDGPAIPALREQAKQLGLENDIYIAGLVGREEMRHWIAQMDIALQPDVVPYASPLKMLEYMYMGKAIIAPDTANIRELLTDNHEAVLFDISSREDFSEKLLRMLKDTTQLAVISQNARQAIEIKTLTWHENAKRIVNISLENRV